MGSQKEGPNSTYDRQVPEILFVDKFFSLICHIYVQIFQNLRELLYDVKYRNLVNYKNQEEKAPIHSIIERLRTKERLECLLTLLVHSDCDVNLKTRAGMSALHLAAKVGSVHILHELPSSAQPVKKE